VTQHLIDFEDKKLQSVAKGRLELGKLEDEAEKQAQEKEESESKPLLDRIKKSLGESVKDVRVTLRLTDSPACLVTEEHDMGANFQRLLKASGQNVPASKPILEINPQHPLVLRLKFEPDDARFTDLAKVLFDQSMLAEGGQLEDPAGFVKRLNQLMLALGTS
jgi:molecular chaperone HtpG